MNNIINWDGKWYNSIVSEGYKYTDGVCNLAFFPFFPLFWKGLGLSALNISLLNFIIFCLSFWLGLKSESFSFSSLIFALALPSAIFFMLPYSESLFFLFSIFIVIGIKNGNHKLQCTGFLLASLTRSVSIIFIPAIIIIYIFNRMKNTKDTIINIFSCLLGTAIAALIQFIDTGKWLYFLEVQKHWGRIWDLPSFPLTTFNPEKIMFLDSLSLSMGLLAVYILYDYLNKYLIGNSKKQMLSQEDLATLFCSLYIAAVFFLDVFFTRKNFGHTNIWSINRHVFSTFFGIWIILKQLNNKNSKFEIIVKSVFLFIGFIITEVYKYPTQIILYIIFISWFYLGERKQDLFLKLLILIVLIYAQISLLQEFLSNKWIG
ncbi:hypothetical protein I6I98_08715 [Sphingobacterium multivorum]|uniref:Integral membrane protein n=1 Tax=Sphingobacterium multivorum TaxID=28454 RepID=A0ABX7CW70_SPHMU|nr:hypothetical protein [Sphingobacterium multivorum]QQT55319.1 hypothetical protein I6I98_08715 [Sphingobacterium multivorum]